MSPTLTPHFDSLSAAAAGHPVLLAVIDSWRGTIRDDQLAGQLRSRVRELDDLRAMIETAAPSYRLPAAPRRIAAEAIVARYEEPEPAWRACVDAGLIPASWLDDPRRRFFDDAGNVVAYPGRLRECIALAADRDGVLAAEDHFRRLAAALAPWGHREPDELYWMGCAFEFEIQSGPVVDALESIGATEICSELDDSGRTTRDSIDAAAIASLLWRDPDTRLEPPRPHLHGRIQAPLDRYRRAPTATLRDPFAQMLALLRTGYGFQFQGSGPFDHVMLIPEPIE